jgi:hypothetical protein
MSHLGIRKEIRIPSITHILNESDVYWDNTNILYNIIPSLMSISL